MSAAAGAAAGELVGAAGLSGVLDAVLNLASPWGYLLIGLLAGLEAAAFLGLVIPGETAMLLGGVLAANGRAGLGVMIAAASTGAVLGDSIGYEIAGNRCCSSPPASPAPACSAT